MTIPIDKIPGIGAYTTAILRDYGYKSAEDLAKANEEALCKVPGFGQIRAGLIIQAARVLCDMDAEKNESRASKLPSPAITDEMKAEVAAVIGPFGKKDDVKKKKKKQDRKSKKEKTKKKGDKPEKKSKKKDEQKKVKKTKKSEQKKKKKKN